MAWVLSKRDSRLRGDSTTIFGPPYVILAKVRLWRNVRLDKNRPETINRSAAFSTEAVLVTVLNLFPLLAEILIICGPAYRCLNPCPNTTFSACCWAYLTLGSTSEPTPDNARLDANVPYKRALRLVPNMTKWINHDVNAIFDLVQLQLTH